MPLPVYIVDGVGGGECTLAVRKITPALSGERETEEHEPNVCKVFVASLGGEDAVRDRALVRLAVPPRPSPRAPLPVPLSPLAVLQRIPCKMRCACVPTGGAAAGCHGPAGVRARRRPRGGLPGAIRVSLCASYHS